jgi:hypothetical protein
VKPQHKYVASELILTQSTNKRAVTDRVTDEYQAGHEPRFFLPVLVGVEEKQKSLLSDDYIGLEISKHINWRNIRVKLSSTVRSIAEANWEDGTNGRPGALYVQSHIPFIWSQAISHIWYLDQQLTKKRERHLTQVFPLSQLHLAFIKYYHVRVKSRTPLIKYLLVKSVMRETPSDIRSHPSAFPSSTKLTPSD